jgi:hypothetical protein
VRPLSPDSERRIHAARFGAELRRAMTKRGVGAKRLSAAIHTGTSAVAVWLAGDNLPRTDTAARLAETLEWPRLAAIARAGRTGHCVRCGRTFVNEGGAPKRYCRDECRALAASARERAALPSLADAVRAEVDRVRGTSGAVSRRVLGDALAEYGRSEAKRVSRSRGLERSLGVVQASVDAMCAGCEPLGVCRDGECALRPVSPLPMALRPDVRSDEIEPAEGPWGPTHRDAQLVAIRTANAERWSRPGERERAGESHRARFGAMSPEERADFGARVSAGRRKAG